MSDCNGRGFCLQQTDLNSYSKSNTTNCIYDCQPIKCPNYLVCDNQEPQCILDCHNNRCYPCNIIIGHNLTITEHQDSQECLICYDDHTTMVKRLECDHSFCPKCTTEFYFPTSKHRPPIFPYAKEVEDRWDNRDEEQEAELLAQYPAIKDWDSTCDIYLDLVEEEEEQQREMSSLSQIRTASGMETSTL